MYLLIRDISQFRGHLMNLTPYQVLLNYTGGDVKFMMPAYLRSERGDEKLLGYSLNYEISHILTPPPLFMSAFSVYIDGRVFKLTNECIL